MYVRSWVLRFTARQRLFFLSPSLHPLLFWALPFLSPFLLFPVLYILGLFSTYLDSQEVRILMQYNGAQRIRSVLDASFQVLGDSLFLQRSVSRRFTSQSL